MHHGSKVLCFKSETWLPWLFHQAKKMKLWKSIDPASHGHTSHNHYLALRTQCYRVVSCRIADTLWSRFDVRTWRRVISLVSRRKEVSDCRKPVAFPRWQLLIKTLIQSSEASTIETGPSDSCIVIHFLYFTTSRQELAGKTLEWGVSDKLRKKVRAKLIKLTLWM